MTTPICEHDFESPPSPPLCEHHFTSPTVLVTSSTVDFLPCPLCGERTDEMQILPDRYHFGYFLDRKLHFQQWQRARQRIIDERRTSEIGSETIVIKVFDEAVQVPLLYRLHIDPLFGDLELRRLTGWPFGDLIVTFASKHDCSLIDAWDVLMETCFSEETASALFLSGERMEYIKEVEKESSLNPAMHNGLPDTVFGSVPRHDDSAFWEALEQPPIKNKKARE